ncbi:class I adenylate-forming enzyme family protein [Nonomuraea endophytica]|uniref:Acyl-CoA synthetase (AMP-forming)/AMP-acid ligase II n=1 Tax=Nonomuraea endophytica TaxID=714136 RepID=A0A7W8EF07_9ACTN|nr:AMP-binding protein [Nonomuraea endophytica]MBB5078235.1 acyl-CoA synthetase (AMP-forming)/AMP-acid ligase II [Nonomuraea endophytica]
MRARPRVLWRSTGARALTPGVTMLFPGPVLEALERAPARPAIEHGDRVVTRGELLGLVARCADGLRARVLRPGSCVLVVAASTPEVYAAQLALHALGCLVGMARPGWGPGRLAEARAAGFDAVLTDAEVAELTAGSAGVVELGARPDDLARLTFTSGSTGRPKAPVQTYRAYSLAYRPDAWPPPLKALMANFERCLVHASLAGPVMMTYLGRTLVAGGVAIIPELPLAEAISAHRATATMMAPPVLGGLLDEGAELRGLRALVLGGAPAAPSLLERAADRLGPVIWQGYGQAEAGVIAMLTPDDVAAGRTGAVGRPLPAVQVSLRDGDGRPVPHGADGEVWVRSPHMMAGYWRAPELTGEVLRDGWLRTRDLGFLDRDGLLHLTGRTRDVIIVGAEVCHAGAIERVLAAHPDVEQAFVVGAPDRETGEAVHAFVVPAAGRAPDVGVLAALVPEALSAASAPKSITVIREVPLNAAGKPDKLALRPTGPSATR